MRGGEARPQEQEASSAWEGEGRPHAEVTLLSTWERDSDCRGENRLQRGGAGCYRASQVAQS